MKHIFTKLKSLGSRGASHHFLLPVIAIVVVGVIGVVMLRFSNAATTDCRSTIIRSGSNNACVHSMQKEILKMGSAGKFGPATEKAVKNFQKSHGLKQDGVVGVNTWGAMCYAYPSATACKSSSTTTVSPAPLTCSSNEYVATLSSGEKVCKQKQTINISCGVNEYVQTLSTGAKVCAQRAPTCNSNEYVATLSSGAKVCKQRELTCGSNQYIATLSTGARVCMTRGSTTPSSPSTINRAM